jgi:phosphoglycerate dehydrogenase-like enzyme
MSLVIASQLEPAFNERLGAHPARPTVIAAPEERPWDAATDADILLVRPSPAWREQRRAPRPASWPGRLRWIYSSSSGIDFYPPWLLEGPPVSCGRGVASDEIAEYVLAAMLAHTKDLDAVRMRSRSDFRQTQLGRVRGSTVGILGLGAIGSAVAERALGLGARVAAVRRRPLPSSVPGVDLFDDIAEVIARSDHLVVALPATDATRGLLGRELLGLARAGAHLINIARGSVLDQQALIEALDRGPLAYATLDVTEPEPLPDGHPLYTHPRVRLTPHVSSNYLAVRQVLFDKVAANFDRFLRGEAPLDLVDPAQGY